MVEAAVEQWKEAGIRVEIKLMPGAEYWDVWTKVPFGAPSGTTARSAIMVLGLGIPDRRAVERIRLRPIPSSTGS